MNLNQSANDSPLYEPPAGSSTAQLPLTYGTLTYGVSFALEKINSTVPELSNPCPKTVLGTSCSHLLPDTSMRGPGNYPPGCSRNKVNNAAP